MARVDPPTGLKVIALDIIDDDRRNGAQPEENGRSIEPVGDPEPFDRLGLFRSPVLMIHGGNLPIVHFWSFLARLLVFNSQKSLTRTYCGWVCKPKAGISIVWLDPSAYGQKEATAGLTALYFYGLDLY